MILEFEHSQEDTPIYRTAFSEVYARLKKLKGGQNVLVFSFDHERPQTVRLRNRLKINMAVYHMATKNALDGVPVQTCLLRYRGAVTGKLERDPAHSPDLERVRRFITLTLRKS